MQKFNFDLQRFTLTFEFTNGTKTYEDRGIIDNTEHYYVYQYYPTTTWNDYLQYQNTKSITLVAINEYRCSPEAVSNGWRDWQETVPGASFSGDYRILRGGNNQYHALENHQASYVKMYGRNDDCVLKNDGGNNALMVGGTGNDYIVNSGNYTTINGGAGADHIISSGSHVDIDAGTDESNDIVENSGSNVEISTGAGIDHITNRGSSTEINAGVGNDLIRNEKAANVVINADAGDDEIHNSGSNVKIFAGKNNDHIENSGVKVTIDAGADAGNDNITNSGSTVQIIAGSGADGINNSGSDVVIDAGADSSNDDIINSGSNVKIFAAAGNNVITNSGSSTEINTGVGNDEIHNTNGTNVVIDAGNGQNNITNAGNSVTINSGADADTVSNSGNSVTIDAGNGQNEIHNEGSTVKVITGEHADLILSNGLDVTIDSGAGDDTVENSAAGAEITLGAGNDTVYNAMQASETTIKTGADVDTITNGADTVSIDSGSEDDVITNTGHSVTIAGGTGNDSITTEGADKVSINADTGDNTVANGNFKGHIELVTLGTNGDKPDIRSKFVVDESVLGGDDVTITTGSDNDVIKTFGGSKVTIDANGGNDQISLGGGGSQNISVKAGAGDDTVLAFEASNDSGGGHDVTIDAGGGNNLVSVGSSWSNVKILGGDSQGANAIFNEAQNALISVDAGNALIENSGEFAIIFGSMDGDVITNYGNNAFIQGDDGKGTRPSKDYIYTDKGKDVTVDAGKDADTVVAYHDLGASINGGAGDDYIALQRLTGTDALNLFGEYLKSIPKSIFEDKVKKFVLTQAVESNFISKASGAGIEKLDNAVGLIRTFFDSINLFKPYFDKLSTESTVCGGAGNDVIVSDGVARRVFEYSFGEGNDEIYFFNVNKAINDNFFGVETQSLYLSTLHVKSGDINSVTLNGKNVLVQIGDGSINLVDAVGFKFKLKEEDGTLTTRAYGTDTKTGEVVCTIFGGNTDDVIEDTINAKNTRYCLYGEGGNDILHGNDKNDTIYGGNGDDIIYGGNGHDFLVVGTAGNNKIFGEDGDDTIKGNEFSTTIDGGAGNDSIYGGKFNDIFGGAGNDKIYVYDALQVKINGGADSDIISVDGGQRGTFSGGTGDDVLHIQGFYHTVQYNNGDGDDIVYGFDTHDTLKITGHTYRTEQIGNDLLVRVGDGSITLKNYGSAKVNVEGTPEAVELPEGVSLKDGLLKLSKLFGGDNFNVNDINWPTDNDFAWPNYIDASEVVKDIVIVGNDLIKHFTGSKYSDVIHVLPLVMNNDIASNDEAEVSAVTIDAGTGNDTVYGGDKPNLYVYSAGDGLDVICNVGAADTLSITGGEFSSVKSGNDILVTVGEGSITLKDAANLSTVNISGKLAEVEPPVDEKLIQGTPKADNLNNTVEGATVQAFGGNDIVTNTGANSSIDGGDGNDKITNNASNVTLNAGTGNDTVTLSGSRGGNAFVYSGGKDVVHKFQSDDTIKVANNATFSPSIKGKDVVLTFDKNNTVTVKDAADGKTITLVDANDEIISAATYSTLGVAQDNSLKLASSFKGTLSPDTFRTIDAAAVKSLKLSLGDRKISNVEVNGATINLEFDDAETLTLQNLKNNTATIGKTACKFTDGGLSNTAGTAVTLSASTKTFTADSKLVTIDAGSTSNATITGSSKANKVSFGDGENVFVWTGGNDILTNFGEDDTLSIAGAVTDGSVKSGDSVINVGKNKITVKDSKQVTFSDSGGTKTFSAGIFRDEDETSVTLGSAVKDFDATDNVTSITGNTKANKLHSGNDDTTLTGGKGNDSLWGGDGSDTFTYFKGDGKDVIFNFGANDLLEIVGLNGAVTGKFNSAGTELTVKVGSTSVAVLKDFTATTFNINGDTYQISGKALVAS